MKPKFFLLSALLLSLLLLSLIVGSTDFSSLLKSENFSLIFYQIRLPRTLSICFVGMALGMSGFVLQSILQNPLAEPYTLGISGGASVGVSIAILFSIYPLWLSLPIFSGLACVLVTVFIFLLARRLGGWDQRSLILAGVVISYFCNSISYVSVSALSPSDIGLAVRWLMGRFGEDRDSWWPFLALAFMTSYVYLYLKSKDLEYYHLGEKLSISFSAKNKVRVIAILLISVLTAITVSIAGVVAFVGLMAPHICLYIFKTVRYKHMLPLSSIMGAILLLSSDLLARVLFPLSDLPAGGIIAILGTPFLLYLLVRRSNDSIRSM
ncbi:MAG: iron ABC transporter permease [Bdellovibrionales bacterium]|nr:iron ABC transporter permease [Bdellovibrionales bacterium]